MDEVKFAARQVIYNNIYYILQERVSNDLLHNLTVVPKIHAPDVETMTQQRWPNVVLIDRLRLK